jgi:RNase P/RNase MRP subunit p29
MLYIKMEDGRVVKITKKNTFFKVRLGDGREFILNGDDLIGDIVKRVIKL